MGDERQPDSAAQPSEESLRVEYAEVNDNIRELTGIRFQLLAFLPVGTVLGAFLLTADDAGFRPVLALFGPAVTIGLLIYNERNDQIYGELISRAKDLEQRLRLHHGQFSDRIGPWQTLSLLPRMKPVKINHSTGINTIYAVSLIAWVYAIVFAVLAWLGNLVASVLDLAALDDIAWWVYAEAFVQVVLALGVSVMIVWLAKRSLIAQQLSRREQMRADAKEAVDKLSKIHLPARKEDNGKWLSTYDCLSRVKEGTGLSSEEQRTAKAKIERRAGYYVTGTGGDGFPYALEGDGSMGVKNACFLASRLTDIPARWYTDNYTARRA